MTDYFSKCPEAAALPNKTARSVAQFIFTTICRYSRQTQYTNASVVPCACYTLALIKNRAVDIESVVTLQIWMCKGDDQ